ncbi:MAG: hypothetical protein ABIW47_18750 [Ginsengibacter sp.]
MTHLKYCTLFLSIVLVAAGCTKFDNDDISFVKTAAAPSDITTELKVSTDNLGMVTIIPNSAGASSYDITFGDTTKAPQKVMAGKSIMHKYAEGNYSVKVLGTGLSGLTTENTFPLKVTFRAPEDIAVKAETNAHDVKVSATAKYAVGGFKVYFGDVPAETPKMMAAGSFLTHTYANAGSYDIKVVALSGGVATAEKIQKVMIYDDLKLPMTFENPNVLYNWGDFGGSETKVIPNPFKSGINTSATVTQIIKKKDQTWAGNYIILSAPIDFSQNQVLKVKVYSQRIGMRVQLQLERNGDNSFQDHKEVLTTKANQWEELTFNFTGIDNSKRLQNILFFLDNGTVGDGTANYTLLIDDIMLTN